MVPTVTQNDRSAPVPTMASPFLTRGRQEVAPRGRPELLTTEAVSTQDVGEYQGSPRDRGTRTDLTVLHDGI